MDIALKGRSFLTLLDYSIDEIYYLLGLSLQLKADKYNHSEMSYLQGKNIALIFEKTSTRTRCAFEVAAYDQGANCTYLGPVGSQIGHKESIRDTARVLGKMYDGIQYRGFGQSVVEELAEYSGIPVWNGLTNEYHPTQVMADFLTMMEHTDRDLNELKLCYIGDARNNTCNSLLVGSAKLGIDFRIAAPAKFQPEKKLIDECMDIAQENGGNILIGENPEPAVNGVDFIYTDVWLSMGEQEDLWKERIELLKPYQVNQQKLDLTNNEDVKFLHCLPAFHNRETKVGQEVYSKYGLDGLEVTEDVFESEHSIVFDQAENRLHTIKAIMVATMGDSSMME